MRHGRALGALILAIGIALWLARREREPKLDPPAVVAQIQQLSQLTTVRYTIQKVVAIEEARHPVGSESILLILQARVEAGIDVSKIQPRDLSVARDGSVTLRLPPAQVLNVALDEKETKVWDRRITWWTPWIPFSKDLEQRARITGIESIKKAALDMGILKQAEQNAESSIRALLELAGVKLVRVIPASVS
jgi:hypothetical protein